MGRSALCFASLWLVCCTTASIAELPKTTASWRKTASLPAAEAHQAAAADAKHVYAVASKKIARYDRLTGAKTGESKGEAHHLNSGFLHAGKLFCAHSNFPAKPERSELKVLDLQTLELTDFKSFGDFGGSLTWAVYKDQSWWCCFAHYGAEENQKTFLARFDEQWKELGRWTFPTEVVRELHGASVSGGVWMGETLVVAGHDDPVLFRLRLSAEGTVLRLVDVQSSPFPGQGIAVDEATGGLVGIHRGKKEVVFAMPDADWNADAGAPLKLRVLSYNIHAGIGLDGKLDLPRLAAVIQAAKPDLVALQEVDKNRRRTGKVDQPAELGRLTGMYHLYGPNVFLDGEEYGNAVLSRFPIVLRENHKLPRVGNSEQRGAMELEVELPGGRTPLIFFATHVDHRPDHAERVASIQTFQARAAVFSQRPLLLAGDLNSEPGSPPLAELTKGWTLANADRAPTFPANAPNIHIDYVAFRPSARWKVVETKVLDEPTASDHRPLLAVLELLPPAAP